MKLEINKAFPCDYEFDCLNEIPSGSQKPFYFPSQNASGQDGLIVTISPHSYQRWLGIFSFGQMDSRAATSISTSPLADHLCVVAKGNGYIVNVEEPGMYEIVKSNPILQVISILKRKLMVFMDYTTFIAHGVNGFIWETERLSWSGGIKIVKVTDDLIFCQTWDIRSEENISFAVDLENGERIAGITG